MSSNRMSHRSVEFVVDVRFSHGTVLLLLAVLTAFLVLVASMVEDSGSNDSSTGVVVTFAINALIGFLFLAKSVVERPFSLVQIHWLFYVTMFVIAPFSQFLYGYSVWGYALSPDDYLVTNLCLTLWGVLFAFASSLNWSRRKDRLSTAHELSLNEFYRRIPEVSDRAVAIALCVSVLATAIVVYVAGLTNLFSRDNYSTGLEQSLSLLFDKGLRPLPVFAFVIALARCKQRGKVELSLFVAAALVLVADFPAAMARYNMACLYGGMALLTFGALFEKKGLFTALFLVAFLVIFPASNAYRYTDFGAAMFVDAVVDALANLPRGFCAVDYDAYSMLARMIDYISSFGIEYGYQLLGVLLFFVPRSIWPSKPEGSGNLVGAAQGQQVLNISAPLPAEGLVNFGYVGLALFAVTLALACVAIDRRFLRSASALGLFYPFLCLLLFFIMRGDLLSSFAYTIGYIASFCFMAFLAFGPKEAFGLASKRKQQAREAYLEP